ncbi:MAG: hypothetical protein ACI9VM_000976, partial [Candidatus Azotimanducaceae bacterium]
QVSASHPFGSQHPKEKTPQGVFSFDISSEFSLTTY